MTISIFYIIIAFLLVLLNAFFVAAEFGMVRLRQTQIQLLEDEYGVRGRILAQIHKHLDAYLSACQLGITLASLGLGWVGEPAFAHLLEPFFKYFNIHSPELITAISFTIAFGLLTFLHIVIGELMPKSLAIRIPNAVSIWTAVPLYGFYWLMYPAIWFLNSCSNILLKLTGLRTGESQNIYSSEEIKLILSTSHLHGELTREETEIIEHTMDLADLEVTEVMRPYEEMISLDIDKPVLELLDVILKTRYSRYPVYQQVQDNMIGIIHVKDLYAALYKHGTVIDLQPLIRPVLKVPDRLPALNLLRKFREGMPHFALVYKLRNQLIGFVTLDNLLHVLIGRIKDEFHRTKDDWIKNEDGTFTVKGDCSIYSLERALEREIDTEENYENLNTLSDLILYRSQENLPKVGERFSYEEFEGVIDEMQDGRIQLVTIFPKIKQPLISSDRS